MEASGQETIAAYLNITLPSEYWKFALSLPKRLVTYWNGKGSLYIEMFSDADWLICQNLQLRQVGPVFAGKSWPHTYLAIGSDGCGNTYCIDRATKTSSAVLLFDHDPANAFVQVSPSWDSFAVDWKEVSAKDTEGSSSRSATIFVTRASIPWKGIMYPILLEEWVQYISSDPEMELVGYREMVNPFTQVVARIETPGYAFWKRKAAAKAAFEHKVGCITTERQNDGVVPKMRHIAKVLDARLLDAVGKPL
jgi:hypothetical protein